MHVYCNPRILIVWWSDGGWHQHNMYCIVLYMYMCILHVYMSVHVVVLTPPTYMWPIKDSLKLMLQTKALYNGQIRTYIHTCTCACKNGKIKRVLFVMVYLPWANLAMQVRKQIYEKKAQRSISHKGSLSQTQIHVNSWPVTYTSTTESKIRGLKKKHPD